MRYSFEKSSKKDLIGSMESSTASMDNNTQFEAMQSMAIKSTLEIVKQWVTSGRYSDARFMLNRLIAQQYCRIRDRSLKKRSLVITN